MPPSTCTLATCNPSQSYYGYRPNLGIDVFFAIVYTAAIAHCLYMILSRRKREWLGYTLAVLVGALLELVGFSARIYGYVHTFVRIGWIIQYSIITVAPVFMTAAIYVCIGRIADTLGRGVFNIRPRLYTRIFIPSDVFALITQAAGGGVSFTETAPIDGSGGISAGQGLILGGLALQVVSLTVFLALFMGVLWPSDLFRRDKKLGRDARRVRTFAVLLLVAIVLIIGRSIFRAVEFSQGIFGALSHDEILFIILDGFPVGIATAILVIFHPFYVFRVAGSDFSGVDLGLRQRFLPEPY
ncbi:RTA1-domain-containing protein [Xylaria intraflava]|nr:RTA1-domain-containing protein [Xylaria intraflava]